MLRAVLTPMALALNRLMVAEAQRFPELAAIVAREGGRAELVGQIAGIFERESRAGAWRSTARNSRPNSSSNSLSRCHSAAPSGSAHR